GPGGDQGVEVQGVAGAAVLLRDAEQQVGELLDLLLLDRTVGALPRGGEEGPGGGDTRSGEQPDQVVCCFPGTGVGICGDVVVGRQVLGLEQGDVAGAAGEDAAAVQAGDGGVPGTCHVVGIAEGAGAVPGLGVPRDRGPGGRVRLAPLPVGR